jgi:hypothetical protein
MNSKFDICGSTWPDFAEWAMLRSGADPTIRVEGKALLEAATCTNPDRRVQANFEQTRKLLSDALGSGAPTK